MRIVTFNGTGDTVTETHAIEEAERILRAYQAQGCLAVLDDGTKVEVPLTPPMPGTVYVLHPMSGGSR